MRRSDLVALSAVIVAAASVAGERVADAQVIHRFSLHGEGGAAWMLTAPPTRSFGIGADATARLGFRIVGPLSVQASVGNWWFRNREVNPAGSPPGRIVTIEAGLRLFQPLGRGALGGPFVDFNAGLAFTAELRRLVFDAGLGWEFTLHPALGLGLFGRYGQVVQPDSEPFPQDARFVSGGVSLTLRVPVPPPPLPPTIPDADRDGIPDEHDRCPYQPEDRDGFEDSDGCRDADNDEDGIPDSSDRCVFEPESRNRYQDDDGCPDDAPVPVAEVRNDRIEISQQIRFEFGTDRIVRESYPILMEVVRLLREHPEIQFVRVEGHADERGAADFNLSLSTRRAASVVAFLREHGVLDTDLEPVGFGSTRPLCRQATERCHSVNRRVEFIITRVAAGTGTVPTTVDLPAGRPSTNQAPQSTEVAPVSTRPAQERPSPASPPNTQPSNPAPHAPQP